MLPDAPANPVQRIRVDFRPARWLKAQQGFAVGFAVLVFVSVASLSWLGQLGRGTAVQALLVVVWMAISFELTRWQRRRATAVADQMGVLEADAEGFRWLSTSGQVRFSVPWSRMREVHHDARQGWLKICRDDGRWFRVSGVRRRGPVRVPKEQYQAFLGLLDAKVGSVLRRQR